MTRNPLPQKFLNKSEQERRDIVNIKYKKHLTKTQSEKTFSNYRSAINHFLEEAGYPRLGQRRIRKPSEYTIEVTYPRYLDHFIEWFRSYTE